MCHVWIVDDSRTILRELENALAPVKKYAEVLFFSSPLRALVEIDDRLKWPDFIVTDVVMPHISGLGMLRIIRNKGCLAPAILLTKTEIEKDILDITVPQNNITDIIFKPIKNDEFLEKVENALHVLHLVGV